jgi:hypothetical protein
MQQLAAAVSPKGITKCVEQLTTQLLGTNMTPPDLPGAVKNVEIPTLGSSIYIDELDISGGWLQNLKTTLKSATQEPNGVLKLVVGASFEISYATWHETGWISSPGERRPTYTPFNRTLSGFSFTVSTVEFTIPIKLSIENNQWRTGLASAVTEANVSVSSPNVPSESALNKPSVFPCVNTVITDTFLATIRGFNYAAAVQSALSAILGTIPESGKLTPSITFRWGPGSLDFLNNDGIALGATGMVQYNGTPYQPKNPDVPLPSVDLACDLVFNVGVDEFGGLLWAFYEQGSLQGRLNKSEIPNPEYLNTKAYKDSLPQLYEFAPDADMEVEIKAASAPTVHDGPLYQLTKTAYQDLQSQLPADTWQHLASMVNTPYVTSQDFNTQLANDIGHAEATAHGTVILGAATLIGLFLDSTWNIAFYVIVNAAPKFAFEMQGEKHDVFDEFGLTAKDTTQAVTFNFKELRCNEKVLRTEVPGITREALAFFWAIANLYVAHEIELAGQAGVALPFIKGFLFTDARVVVEQSYVHVITDVRFDANAFNAAEVIPLRVLAAAA